MQLRIISLQKLAFEHPLTQQQQQQSQGRAAPRRKKIALSR